MFLTSWTADSNLTRLFEGEPGHLVPSASHFLVESDMFTVAGRMVGHSFLHGGPCLQGLSAAVVHVLLGGSPELQLLHWKTVQTWTSEKQSGLYVWLKTFFSFSNMLCTMGHPFIVYPLSLMSDFIYGLLSWSLKGDPRCQIRRSKVSRTWPLRGTLLRSYWSMLWVKVWEISIQP